MARPIQSFWHINASQFIEEENFTDGARRGWNKGERRTSTNYFRVLITLERIVLDVL